MLIDITLNITPHVAAAVPGAEKMSLAGHLGTHFDVMDRQFPLEYTERPGIVFDVRSVADREIGVSDIDLSAVERHMFVAFCTGFLDRVGYGGEGYFTQHPQLSMELIDGLLDRGISILALDFAGVRRGKEHIPTDQACAERGVFVVENLCNLDALLAQGGRFTACTYPVSYAGMTGLPCRVIAKIP